MLTFEKPMINRLKYWIGAVILTTTAACETDLKVNADYSTTAIVYGVLETADTIHIIKINRTFLGDGNALDFAQRADSSKIDFTERPIVERLVRGEVVRTYEVRDTVIGGKPDGTFYSGASTYYYFVDPLLTPSIEVEYRLRFVSNGKNVSTKTLIVSKSTQTSPSTNNSSFELLKNDVRFTDPQYQNILLKVSAQTNTKRVEATVTFTYEEQYLDGTSTMKSINLGKATMLSASSKASSLLNTAFDARNIMQLIANEVKPDANVKQRVIGNIGINLVSAGEDLNTYIEVNNPATGVLQERPEFTNVNNGIGIFSSSYNQSSILPVGDKTSRALGIQEQYIDLKFCSTRPTLQTELDVKCN